MFELEVALNGCMPLGEGYHTLECLFSVKDASSSTVLEPGEILVF